MSDPTQKWRSSAVLGLAVLLGVGTSIAVGIGGGRALADGPGCVEAKKVEVASGRSPGRAPWRIDAAVESRDGCDGSTLRLGYSFDLTGRKGGWSVALAIPSNGHLDSDYTLTAQDQTADNERVFSGLVGARTRKIVAILSSGKRLVIRPPAVAKRLRTQNAWLRGIRTFMRFYPAGQKVRVAKLFDKDGKLIASRRGLDGYFDPAIS
jgi:hypothetical protein